MPPENRSRSMIHPVIFVRGTNIMPPWLDTSCHSFDHPHTGFLSRFACHTDCWPSCLIHCHTFRNKLVPPQQTMNEFPCICVLLKAACITTGLGIEHDYISTFAYLFIVAKTF